MKKKLVIISILAITLMVALIMVGCAPNTPDKMLKQLAVNDNYSLKMVNDKVDYEFVDNNGKYYLKLNQSYRYIILNGELKEMYSMINGNWSYQTDPKVVDGILNNAINLTKPFINKIKEFSTNLDDYKIIKNVWQHKVDGYCMEVVDNRLQVILAEPINNRSTFSYAIPKDIVLPDAAAAVKK